MSLGHPIRPAAVLHNSQVTWLTHVWHDSFIRDMTLVYRIEWQISIIFPSPGIPSLKSQLITCADVAARHSVLQCVAVCCSVLQCVAVCYIYVIADFHRLPQTRGGGLGSRPKKMYGERLGDGIEYHLMKPTPRR